MFNSLFTNPVFLFCIGFLGIITHFLKKYESDQLNSDIDGRLHNMYVYFFQKNVINTVYSFIAYVILFIITLQMGELGILTMFSAGYMSDSLFNKMESGVFPIKGK